MHCGDQRHLGLCLGYVPALAYGSCRVSDQGTTLRASDLHNARATILNPFNEAVKISKLLIIGPLWGGIQLYLWGGERHWPPVYLISGAIYGSRKPRVFWHLMLFLVNVILMPSALWPGEQFPNYMMLLSFTYVFCTKHCDVESKCLVMAFNLSLLCKGKLKFHNKRD